MKNVSCDLERSCDLEMSCDLERSCDLEMLCDLKMSCDLERGCVEAGTNVCTTDSDVSELEWDPDLIDNPQRRYGRRHMEGRYGRSVITGHMEGRCGS